MVLPNILEPNTEIWLLKKINFKVEIWWLEKNWTHFLAILKIVANLLNLAQLKELALYNWWVIWW